MIKMLMDFVMLVKQQLKGSVLLFLQKAISQFKSMLTWLVMQDSVTAGGGAMLNVEIKQPKMAYQIG